MTTMKKLTKNNNEIKNSLTRRNNELNPLILGFQPGLRRGLHMCSKFLEGHCAN